MTDAPTPARLPTYFLSHGGGPWPWMPEMRAGLYGALEASLAGLLGRHDVFPRAILMVTAHWEEAGFVAGSAAAPGMIYDYGGFPPHTYQVRYPAPGDPALAARVAGLLGAAGLASGVDGARGFDHGTFSPMQVIRPQADIPVVQMSIRADYDPDAHTAAGRALAPLRDEGVLIVGSGLSWHNLRRFGAAGAAPSAAFDGWLNEALVVAGPEGRAGRLAGWAAAPGARAAHPREDHLMPLMVAAGAAEGAAAVRTYHQSDFAGGLSVSSFRFG